MAKYFEVNNRNGKLLVDDSMPLMTYMYSQKLSDFTMRSAESLRPYIGNQRTYIITVSLPPNAEFFTFSCDGANCSGLIFRIIPFNNEVLVVVDDAYGNDISMTPHILVNFYGKSEFAPRLEGKLGLEIFDENGKPIFTSLQRQFLISKIYQYYYDNSQMTRSDPDLSRYHTIDLEDDGHPIEIMMNSANHTWVVSSQYLFLNSIAHCIRFFNDKQAQVLNHFAGDWDGIAQIISSMMPYYSRDYVDQFFYANINSTARTQILVMRGV